MLWPMGGPRTYTLSELETRSGFDKRTIAYYVQELLLPKVGRRGRRTRYSEEFLDRLMFIRRVRDLQDAGKLRAVTLSEIRDVLDRQSAEDVRAASRKGVSAETLRALFTEPDLDTLGFAVAAEDMASLSLNRSNEPGMAEYGSGVAGDADSSAEMSVGRRREAMALRSRSRGPAEPRAPRSQSGPSSEESDSELQTLLQEVELRTQIGAQQSRGRTRERVTRVPITEDITLSVRNIDDKDAHLVEKLAEFLRRLGRLGGS
jgi:DNA-binding transcriptional MerR regulator